MRVNSCIMWNATNSVFQNGIRPAIVVWYNAPSLDINPNELHSLHHPPSYMPGSQTHTYPPGEGWHELQWLQGSLHTSMSARIESRKCNFWKGQIYGKTANDFIIQLFSNFLLRSLNLHTFIEPCFGLVFLDTVMLSKVESILYHRG